MICVLCFVTCPCDSARRNQTHTKEKKKKLRLTRFSLLGCLLPCRLPVPDTKLVPHMRHSNVSTGIWDIALWYQYRTWDIAITVSQHPHSSAMSQNRTWDIASGALGGRGPDLTLRADALGRGRAVAFFAVHHTPLVVRLRAPYKTSVPASA